MINCGDKKGYAHTFISNFGRCLCGKTSRAGLDKLMSRVEKGECTLQEFSIGADGAVKETWSQGK